MIDSQLDILRRVERWRGCAEGARSILALYRTAFELYDYASLCPSCSGRGVLPWGGMIVSCARCRGVGYVLRLEDL